MVTIIKMGSSCVTNIKDRKRKWSGDEVPEGTDELRGLSLPDLDFELAISNI